MPTAVYWPQWLVELHGADEGGIAARIGPCKSPGILITVRWVRNVKWRRGEFGSARAALPEGRGICVQSSRRPGCLDFLQGDRGGRLHLDSSCRSHTSGLPPERGRAAQGGCCE